MATRQQTLLPPVSTTVASAADSVGTPLEQSEQRRQRILHHMLWPYIALNAIGILFTHQHIQASLAVAVVMLGMAFVLNRRGHVQMAAILAVLAAFQPSYIGLNFLTEFNTVSVLPVSLWTVVGILLGMIWLTPTNLFFVLTLNYFLLASAPLAIQELQWSHLYVSLSLLFVISIIALIASVLRHRELLNLDQTSSSLRDKQIQLQKIIHDLNAEMVQKTVAQERLKSRELMLSIISDHVWDGVALIDSDGNIESCNKHLADISGIERSQLESRNAFALIPDLHHLIHTTPAQFHFENRQAQLVGGLGKKIAIELSCTPVTIERDEHYVLTIRDISEGVRMEKMKDEFIATVSHELRTPITAILGAIGIMRGIHRDRLDDKLSSLVEIGYNNSVTLSKLVNDILDISKLEAGKLEFNLGRYSALALLRDTLNDNATYASQFKVSMQLDCTPENDAQLTTDPIRFKQIINNLLSNAIKYSPENGCVDIGVHRHDEELQISVSDHGPGIPVEFQDKIFCKFAQSQEMYKQVIKGTGLGLFLTRALVRQLQGEVWFESDKGKGTTFHVSFPVAQDDAGNRNHLK
jgi:PAS domain S-box-containing protein